MEILILILISLSLSLSISISISISTSISISISTSISILIAIFLLELRGSGIKVHEIGLNGEQGWSSGLVSCRPPRVFLQVHRFSSLNKNQKLYHCALLK